MTKANIALLRALGAGQVSAQTGSVDDFAKAESGAFAVERLHTRVLFGVSHFGFTRTRTLNGTLRETFQRWWPAMTPVSAPALS